MFCEISPCKVGGKSLLSPRMKNTALLVGFLACLALVVWIENGGGAQHDARAMQVFSDTFEAIFCP